MSERLETTEPESTEAEAWATGQQYSLMKVDAGVMGQDFYYSLPTFTILVKTEEELKALNEEFSAVFSKYTDGVIVGTPREASLILSVNQAALDLETQNDIINTLRDKIKELTGSYEAAGDWKPED
jgi:PAS domain-containing protein